MLMLKKNCSMHLQRRNKQRGLENTVAYKRFEVHLRRGNCIAYSNEEALGCHEIEKTGIARKSSAWIDNGPFPRILNGCCCMPYRKPTSSLIDIAGISCEAYL